MNKLYKVSKYILLIGLPGILVGCMLMRHYYPRELTVEWVYFVAFTGLIGIVTNTIAVRMLFHPKEPNFIGQQGLIPKNKLLIADKIAGETEKRLLNVDTIMDHIAREQVIEETISLVTKTAEDYLAQKSNRKNIADIILGFYNEYTDKIFIWLIQSAEVWLSDIINRPDAVEAIWGVLKPQMKRFFESELLKHQTSTWIIHNLIEKSPEIALSISHTMEKYIEDQVPWKKTMLKGFKDFFGLEKEAIEELVLQMLNNPETYNQVTVLIENNLQNIEEYLEQDEVHKKLEEIRDWLKRAVLEANRHKAIPALREKIDLLLKKDSSWETIDRHLVMVMKAIPAWLKAYLHRPASIQKIRDFLPSVITKLNIRQIMVENIKNQDTDEFEQMIMKISGENFAAIEVLGGVLGMIAGLTVKCLNFL